MRSVEATGKTMEEAVAGAARALGVEPDELTVEVLEEPKKLLGLFPAHEVKIRATVEDSEPAGTEEPMPEQESQPEPADEQKTEPGDDSEPADAGEYAREVIDGVLQRMGLDATAQLLSANRDELSIEVVGPDSKHVIGRHGETLNALQLLVGIIVSRRFNDAGRIALDAEGYREQRRQMLERMAHQHAEQAKEAGKEIVIKDLKPHERRIVHLALRDDPEIETYSEGEGDDRYLVISPIIE